MCDILIVVIIVRLVKKRKKNNARLKTIVNYLIFTSEDETEIIILCCLSLALSFSFFFLFTYLSVLLNSVPFESKMITNVNTLKFLILFPPMRCL